MITLEAVTTFVGWCTVINIVFILLALVAIGLMHDFIGDIAGKVFGISRDDAKRIMFTVVQQYRLVVIFFNLVPYIALKIMLAA